MTLQQLPQELFALVLGHYVNLVSVREAVCSTRVNRRFRRELLPALIQNHCLVTQHCYPFYDYPVPLVAQAIAHELHNPARFDDKIPEALRFTAAVIYPDLDPHDSHAVELALCAAFIRHQTVDRLLFLLKGGKRYQCNDPLWKHDDKTDPLAAAAALGNCTALRRLLAQGVDLTRRSFLFGNPLVAAASANQVDALRLLSDVSLEAIELKPWYHPCLCQAAYHGATDAVRFLLSKPFLPIQEDKSVWQKATSSLLSFFPGGLTLHPAVAANLSSGPRFTEAFECACFGNNNLEICKLLFDRIDRVHRKASLDRGLTRACQMGRYEVARFLLDAGASIDMVGNRENHLTWAIQSGAPKLVQLLLRRGADPDCAAIPLFGCCLQLAARHHEPSMVQMLLDHGADPMGHRAATLRPSSVLSIAAWEGRLSAIQVLVERGADLELDDNGLLALCNAARAGHRATVEYLIQQGISVNQIFDHDSEPRQSPLGAALAGSHARVVEPILRSHGACVAVWKMDEALM